MPRPKKAKPEEVKEPLVMTQPSEPFYKAFMFEEQVTDMIVDVSGDNFSDTIEGAIKTLFAEMSTAKILDIPELVPLVDDEELRRNEDGLNENLNRIIVIQMRCHDVEEFKAAKGDSGPDSFWLELKKCPAGYVVALQEYTISQLNMYTKSTEMIFHLTYIRMVGSDDMCKSELFPQVVEISV